MYHYNFLHLLSDHYPRLPCNDGIWFAFSPIQMDENWRDGKNSVLVKNWSLVRFKIRSGSTPITHNFWNFICVSYILIVLSVCDVIILLFHSMAKLASAFSTAELACGSWWRPFVTELGSITEGRPGPARHSRTPGFSPTGPAVGGAGPGPSQKADRV
jgi:hypothetical protein